MVEWRSPKSSTGVRFSQPPPKIFIPVLKIIMYCQNLFIKELEYISLADRGARLRATGWAFFYCALCYQFINLATLPGLGEWSFLVIFLDSLAATTVFAILSFLAFRVMALGDDYRDSTKYSCVEYVLLAAPYARRLTVWMVIGLGVILIFNGYLYYVDFWIVFSIMMYWLFLYFYTLYVGLVTLPDLQRTAQ